MTGKLKVRIPYTFGDTGKDLEPFTESYPEYGQGGELQMIPIEKMIIKYDRLDLLPNPRTDIILKEVKYWRDEYLVLKNLIEKYCETEDRNRLMKILETEDRFLFKYFINEFSKLKIPNKMTSKELEEYEKKIIVYI